MSYTVTGTIKRETDNAILVHDEESDEDVWFPLSQVDSIHRVGGGGDQVVVTDWIAKQKGLT